jgi:Lar family restriction alleviation protein
MAAPGIGHRPRHSPPSGHKTNMECTAIILPCPFCGSPKTYLKAAAAAGFAVVCESCGGVGPGDEIKDCAVQRWNSRSALAASFRLAPRDERARPIFTGRST